MQDLRPRLESEVDESLGARKIRPCIREKVTRDKNAIMSVKRALELSGDDGPAQFDRQGLDGQVIPRLVDGMVEARRKVSFRFPDMLARFSSKNAISRSSRSFAGVNGVL
jgi:hypothetical protein